MVRCPSVPVGSAIMPKTPLGSWAGLFPLLLLSIKRAVWHTHGDHAGYEVALLAQLGCHWKKAPLASNLKRFLFPATNSLPYSSVRETDIPSEMPLRGREEDESVFFVHYPLSRATFEGSSQYKYILRFHYSTKVGQAHL